MRSAFALRIFSGIIIYNFGIAERLRTLRYPIFTGRGLERTPSVFASQSQLPRRGSLWRARTLCSLAENRTAMPKAPSQRTTSPAPGEDVAQRQKGESVIERSEMTGGVLSPKSKHRNVRRRSGACFYNTFTMRKVFPRLMQSSSRSYSAGTSPMTFTFSSAGKAARTSWISPE